MNGRYQKPFSYRRHYRRQALANVAIAVGAIALLIILGYLLSLR